MGSEVTKVINVDKATVRAVRDKVKEIFRY